MPFSLSSPVGALTRHPVAGPILAEYLTEGPGGPPDALGIIPLRMVIRFAGLSAEQVAELEARLAGVPEADTPAPQPIEPDPDYQREAPPAPWQVTTDTPSVWRPVEIAIDGPSHGNPFVDVALHADVAGPNAAFRVTGFYDGDGTYRVRFLPDAAGTWSFTTSSNAAALSGLSGTVDVAAARAGDHGPVRADGFHLVHADGTRHLSLGTTCYAWTHQGDEREEQTLATLAGAPFTKIRMCVFPKHYVFNRNDPPREAFARDAEGAFDTTRPNPDYFQHLERRIAQLDALGIQADLILFHPYDRWGYADLGAAADDRYLTYLVARLSAFPNVWWSLANEYDLMGTKTFSDWERFARVINANDPVGHLLGNHNCMEFFDNDQPWITHSSLQRVDITRTAENTTEWRERWGKPVVLDEIAYEGDIDQGWGNITGEEMTRRFWEGALRGGYPGHGETYLADDEVLWWSKGGVLKGTSPARIAFLRQVLEDAPGVLEPEPTSWDSVVARCGDDYLLHYFSFMRPGFRMLTLPEGTWRAEVLDTWEMTITPVEGELTGRVRIDLPAKQYIAIRLTRI